MNNNYFTFTELATAASLPAGDTAAVLEKTNLTPVMYDGQVPLYLFDESTMNMFLADVMFYKVEKKLKR